MSFFDRLMKFAKSQGYDTPTALAKELGYSSGEKLLRLGRNKNAHPSYDILKDIADKFANAPLRWLITGQFDEKIDNTPALPPAILHASDDAETYTPTPNRGVASPKQGQNASPAASPNEFYPLLLEEKERVIQQQRDTIAAKQEAYDQLQARFEESRK